MADFQTTTTVRSRRQRACPECRAGIGIGQRYRKVIGRWEGDFYTAIMCEPCGAFTDRYFASMHNAGFLNADEVAVTFGDIINEAVEYVGLEERSRRLALPRKREAVHALFDGFDEAERAWRRRERDNAIEARKLAQRIQSDRIIGARLAFGMASCSAPLPQEPRP